MCTYLHQRGATYYYRRVIPTELRPAIRKSEFMLSLRTKDRAEAKRLVPGFTIETDRLMDEARRKLVQNAPEKPAQARSAAAEYEAHQTEYTSEAAALAGAEADAREERYMAREEDQLAMLKRWNETATVKLPYTEQVARDLWRDAMQAAETAQHVRVYQAATERARMVDALPPAIGIQATKPEAEPTGTMLDTTITDKWAAERKVEKKTEDAHRAVARWFYERVGRKGVDQITRADVLAFKDALVAEGQTLGNVKVKLSRLRTLLQWAADNAYASTNVGQGVSVKDTDKGRNKRLPFDLAALNRIFSSPIYTEGARPVQGRGEAAYWLPLLALFTGARMEELGQLRPSDVQQVEYPDAEGATRSAWLIRIREDDEDGLKLKNAGSERDVPVHPELERLGFISFVQAAQKAKQERLFIGLRPNTYGRLTAKWSEWFNPYMREVCGITDKRMVFHSFRHTFKDYARHSGIEEGVQRQIMGHSSGDVADQYGSGYPLYQVVEGMRRYRVPGMVCVP